MLTCEQLTGVVTEYLEGRMPLLRRLEFHLHIGMCRHCRAYLRQMRTTLKLVGSLPNEPMPADVERELIARLRHMAASEIVDEPEEPA